MPMFEVQVSVEAVHGHQVFRFEAKDAEDAYQKARAGKLGESEFVMEEIEVTNLNFQEVGRDCITPVDVPATEGGGG